MQVVEIKYFFIILNNLTTILGGIGFVGTGFGSQPEENWYSSKSALIGTISKRFREAENLVNKPGNIGIGLVTAHCKADPSYFDQILSLW